MDNTVQTPQPVQSPQPVQPTPQANTPTKDHAPTVAIFLIWLYPVGVILMWKWMKNWSKLIKFFISLPLIAWLFITVVGIIISISLIGRINNNALKYKNALPTPPPFSTNTIN